MAINKNFSVKNGIDVGQNATITGSLTAAGLSYPVSDGDQFQAIITDGSGNLSFGNVDTVESDVTNNTGSLIAKGTPVYQTGASGNTLTIAPSDASDAATMPAIGVAASDIANGDTGRVIHFGYIHGVDTSAFTEGDRIYVADGGGYQVGRPTGETNVVQFLGVVTKVHATNGSGVVFGGGRAHAVPNLNDGNIFIGDNTNSPVTATLDTSIVPENGNIYFTDQRAIDAIEGSTNLTINGGDIYVDTATHRVGIGDTSPQHKLDVAGGIGVGGTEVITSTGQVVTAQLQDSGVTANTYGSASLVPIITVDSKGRITSASTTSVAGVSNFTFNTSTDVLTISTADGGSYTSDISGITVGGSMDGPLANLTVKYQSTAPSTPSQGQIYFDSLNQLLMIYTGSGWVQTIPSSTGSSGGTGVTDAVATFQKYTYTLSSTTNAVSGASEQVIDAGDFTIGKKYQIRTVGDTDFTAIGASANTVGTVFTATGIGEGTGDAYTYLDYSTAGAQNVEVFVNGTKQVEGASADYVATTGTAVTFTYNIPTDSVVDVQVYELLTQDAFYLKADTYTKTEVNSQISTAVSAYLPLTGGTLTGALNGTSATLSGGLTVDTNTLVVDNTNNRVGIGTTSPEYELDIRGDDADGFGGQINISSASNPSVRTFVGINSTGKYGKIYSVESGVGYLPLILNEHGGNVGIGTTSPTYALDVETDNSGGLISSFVNTATSIPQGILIDFPNATPNATNRYFLQMEDSTSIKAKIDTTGGGYFMGNVGIGTTIPTATLDVNGNMVVEDISGRNNNNGHTAEIKGMIAGHAAEDNPLQHPFLFNDIAYLTARGGVATWTTSSSSGAVSRDVFKPSSEFWGYGNDTGNRVIELSDFYRGMSYGCKGGITFGNSNWAPSYVKAEYSYDNGSTYITAYENSVRTAAHSWAMSTPGSAITNIRITISQDAPSSSTRITNIWAFSYSSIGLEGNALGRSGGSVHDETPFTFYEFGNRTTSRGSITVNTSGTTYNTTSDRRLKDNIVTITDGKEKLLAMNPVTHTWKADPNTGETVHGFIAQEMQQIVPEAVSGDPESDEMMSMDYGRITPVIVAALQDALKEIEELKERIKTLEAK